MRRNELSLGVKAPFHLEATARVLQRRDSNPIDRWNGERWAGVVPVDGKAVVARVRNAGSVDAPDVRLETEDERVVPRVRERLGLDVDPAPLSEAIAVLPEADVLQEKLRGLRPPCYGSSYEAVLSVIPFQQLSLDAGIAIFGRFIHRYGRRHPVGDDDECYSLPDVEVLASVDVEEMRSLGFSHAKGRAFVGCAEAFLRGEINDDELRQAPLKEALPKLKTLPGIGPWSAHLMMLRGFGRLDSFPPGDSGVAKSLSALTRRPVTAADARKMSRNLGDQAGWLYYLSLAASLVAGGAL